MKRIKMLLYGEPGVGKSVFASRSPKPFFITTDGNYEWLIDFGADPNAHVQVNTWEEAKKAFAMDFDGYETIVVDLLEDLFKWCEYEYCKKSRIEHISDVGYGKGYDITRNEFFLEISKLLSKDKNVILITHGITFVTKDRRGVEHTRYAPSNRIPDKVMDMIEGRLRYCLRCYLKVEEQTDGTLAKKRYLSLVPKENEFGIIRGVDENTLPQDIDLNFDEFAKYIGLYNTVTEERAFTPKTVSEEKTEEVKPARRGRGHREPQPEQPADDVPFDMNAPVTPVQQPVIEQAKTTEPMPSVAIAEAAPQQSTAEVKVAPEVRAEAAPARQQTNADKIAAIKAKIAALNGKK